MADRATSTTSTAQQVKAAQDAGKLHDWPEEAGACDDESYAIFVKHQSFKAYQDWTPTDLIELGRVSVLQSMAVYETEKLMDEGLILYGGKTGLTPFENPRNRAVATLNSTIANMLRRMGLTAAHATPDRQGRAAKGRAAQEREAEAAKPPPPKDKRDERPRRNSLI